MTTYNRVVDNARNFDDRYIALKEMHIYCGSETLIKDYLLVKSMCTPTLYSVIVAAKTELPSLRRYFHAAINDSGLTSKYQSFYKQHIKFRNGSRIYMYDYEFGDLAMKGLQFNIIYATNSAAPHLFYDNTMVDFTRCLSPTECRVIYNFDP
jgi:hypothetical protein